MLQATPKAIGAIGPFVSFVVKSLVLGFVAEQALPLHTFELCATFEGCPLFIANC